MAIHIIILKQVTLEQERIIKDSLKVNLKSK